MTVALPSSYVFGKVVGRIVHAVADTAADADALPEAQGARGKVKFTPLAPTTRTTVAAYPAIVLNDAVTCQLDAQGNLLDPGDANRQGVWLPVGLWRAEFIIDGTLPTFEFELTADATDQAPLNLAVAAPYAIPPSSPVSVWTLPPGGAQGAQLVKASNADGQAVWRQQRLTIGQVTAAAAGANPSASIDFTDPFAPALSLVLPRGADGGSDAQVYAAMSAGAQSKAYLDGRYAALAHAARHASGGADPVTPAAIGAAAAGHTHAYAAHANLHAAGGIDQLTPAAIGAAAAGHTHALGAPQTATIPYKTNASPGYPDTDPSRLMVSWRNGIAIVHADFKLGVTGSVNIGDLPAAAPTPLALAETGVGAAGNLWISANDRAIFASGATATRYETNLVYFY